MLLTEFHSSMLAGHFGAKKMYSLLSEHVWWPNMLGHASMLVVPALFAKSKRTVHRLPLGCCSLCQYLLGGSNPGA